MSVIQELAKVYRGKSQHLALKTIFVGLITGEPVLLIGPHGTFKSSMAAFVGRTMEKPVAVLSTDAKSFGDIEAFAESLGKEIGADPEVLMQNRALGVNVEYTDYPGYVRVKATVDLARHKINADEKTAPISVFSAQINDQMDPEDILGYAVHHKALLGNKPPHVIKTGKLSGADYVVLDEAFAAPRLMSKLHTAVNEKVVDTAIGPVPIAPLTFVFCTNPWNQFYQTNPKVVNAATLDRFLASCEVDAPSAAEILYTMNALKGYKILSRLPAQDLLAAREEADSVKIPSEIMRFCVGLVSALSSCYFSPTKDEIRDQRVSPFLIDKDCSICRYSKSICAFANVGKVRSIASLMKVMKASAFIEGRKEAGTEDLEFALKTALPHRMIFSQDYIFEKGTPHAASWDIVGRYAWMTKSFSEMIQKIMGITNAEEAAAVRTEVMDNPSLRALVDDVIDAMKGSKKDELPADLLDSIRAFSPRQQQQQEKPGGEQNAKQ